MLNHEPALFNIQSGKLLPGLPSLGSWVVYGLGSENQNLPAYVVLDDPKSRLPIAQLRPGTDVKKASTIGTQPFYTPWE